MKKFLVLLLVLGIAGSASAALQLSVDGVRDVPESDLWITEVDGTVEIEIWTDAQISAGVGEGYWALGVSGEGVLSGGQGLYGGDTSLYLDSTYLPAGEQGYWLGIGMATNPLIAADADAFDSILLTCSGPGDSVVTLYTIDWGANPPVEVASVTIHQIPEPATICLLGLGGLALLRRRK